MNFEEYKQNLLKRQREAGIKHRVERDEFIDKFLVRLNTQDREKYFQSIGKKYKPITPRALLGIINRKFGSSKTPMMRDLFKECEKANNFEQFFWWKVKLGKTQKLF